MLLQITLVIVLAWLLPATDSSSLLRQRRSTSCTIPSFEGTWERLPDYPFPTNEAHGGFVGGKFIVTGGFFRYPDASTATAQTWAFDTSIGRWQRRANYPMSDGVTHAAMAINGDKLYICGGYLGGNPGPATEKCFVYQSSTDTWTSLPDMPLPRAAGGLVYSQSSNALIFATGADRVAVGGQESVSFEDAWRLDLNSVSNTWTSVANSLLSANHISSVTGIDGSGMEHFYVLGGQDKENDETGNKDQVEEYLMATNTWTSRKAMTLKRGHANAATIPYQCGFLIAGGGVNRTVQSPFQIFWDFLKGIWDSFWGLFSSRSTIEPSVTTKIFSQGAPATADISFYDIATDTWTMIGEFTSKAKTLVCDIKEGYLYCGMGGSDEFFRRKISA